VQNSGKAMEKASLQKKCLTVLPFFPFSFLCTVAGSKTQQHAQASN